MDCVLFSFHCSSLLKLSLSFLFFYILEKFMWGSLHQWTSCRACCDFKTLFKNKMHLSLSIWRLGGSLPQGKTLKFFHAEWLLMLHATHFTTMAVIIAARKTHKCCATLAEEKRFSSHVNSWFTLTGNQVPAFMLFSVKKMKHAASVFVSKLEFLLPDCLQLEVNLCRSR